MSSPVGVGLGPPPASSDPSMPAQPQDQSSGSLVSGDASSQGGGDPRAMLKQVLKMTSDIDQALSALAGVFAKDGGDEVAQARKLIESGARKFLSKFGQAPALNPTETGSNFPGGGLTSNQMP